MPVAQANMQDALNIGQAKIMVDGEQWGYVTGLTIDGRSPEDLITVFGGKLRRQQPAEFDWSADAVLLYGNAEALQELKDGRIFQIVVDITNPSTVNPDNVGGVFHVHDCRVSDHSINLGESSTFRMSGKCKDWSFQSK